MPRNMSFALTTEQVRNQTKTVTRRQGWANLKPGILLQPVVKGMGLKKGEKVEKIGGLIRVLSVRREMIWPISSFDLVREGFPEMSRDDFVRMYCTANKVLASDYCHRIEFEYVNEGNSND
ncbi:MAG: hypothetical protein KAJ19_07585 [Gammaproteobacteria bacterium]|nr:hypothetical protein [Gammaproteobacteria bacterium]